MKILIAGGNGFIGRSLVVQLLERGHQVTVLDRSVKSPINGADYVQADLMKHIDPAVIAMHQVVVHLAGAPIAGRRWTEKYKKILRRSRIETARRLIDAIRALPVSSRPNAVIGASAIGWYGNSRDKKVDERTPHADDFLAKLCNDWEHVWGSLDEFGIRRVSVRTGVVLDGRGGLVATLKEKSFRYRIAMIFGSGKQYLSWVGLDDLARIYAAAIESRTLSGPVNAVAPEPIQLGDMIRSLGGRYGARVPFFLPSWFVRLALGQASDVVLFSQRVYPSVLTKSGFKWKQPNMSDIHI